MIGVNRRRVMGGSSLPNESEIEYLESNGLQWIDTGYIPNANTQLYVEFSIRKFNSNIRDATAPFGVRSGWGNKQFVLFSPVNDRNTEYFCYGNSYTQKSIALQLNTRIICTIDKNHWVITTNGTSEDHTFSSTESSRLPTLNTILFSYSNNGTVVIAYNVIDIYRFYVMENDVKVLDYKPYRVGSVGYMKDVVDGSLHGNDGTGDFVLGPDKN